MATRTDKSAPDAEGWEDVDVAFGEKFAFDKVGDIFTGVFDGVKTVRQNDGTDAPAAQFHNADGTKMWCWIPTQLRTALIDGDVKPGMEVRIECTGEEPQEGRLSPMKLFSVKQRKPRN